MSQSSSNSPKKKKKKSMKMGRKCHLFSFWSHRCSPRAEPSLLNYPLCKKKEEIRCVCRAEYIATWQCLGQVMQAQAQATLVPPEWRQSSISHVFRTYFVLEWEILFLSEWCALCMYVRKIKKTCLLFHQCLRIQFLWWQLIKVRGKQLIPWEVEQTAEFLQDLYSISLIFSSFLLQ